MTKLQTILVTGSTGQLGQSIKSISPNYPDYEFVFANRKQLDLSNKANITNFFEHQTFDVIINCAAYTAVDKAESERSVITARVNTLASINSVDNLADLNSRLARLEMGQEILFKDMDRQKSLHNGKHPKQD